MPKLEAFAAQATQAFSSELKAAIVAAELPGLGDGPVNPQLTDILDSDIESHLGDLPSGDSNEIISALWLLAGDIDRSHDISQDLPSAEGSFLHGIMHRREGDFGNAKYWFRRVGNHSVLSDIAGEVGDLYSDPFDFIDQCSQAVRTGENKEGCQNAQWLEWQLLLTHLLGQ